MVEHGPERLGNALRLARVARAALAKVDGLQVVDENVIGRPGAHGLDETKLVIDVRGLRLSGFQAADWLYAECRINVELCDQRRIMALLSIGDTDRSVRRLVHGLQRLADWARATQSDCVVRVPSQRELLTDTVMSPREAFFARSEAVPMERAVGRVAAEMLSPYPPGIPLFAPGERINAAAVCFVEATAPLGMYAPDVSDPSFKTVRVVC
jgi:arginine/lysine/ornithine decarboxylase